MTKVCLEPKVGNTTRVCSIDLETRSVVDLTKTNVYVYAAHPLTDVLCCAYKFDDEPAKLWISGVDDPPEDLFEHIRAGKPLYAWNAQFERILIRDVLVKRYGWPEPKLEQYYCTAAYASAMALPRKLESCAIVMRTVAQKDMAGSELMRKMMRPIKVRLKRGQVASSTAIEWYDGPHLRERLGEYCQQDVETEHALRKRLFPLSATERAVYMLDQQINDRGVEIDIEAVRGAYALVKAEQEAFDGEIKEASLWQVNRPSERAKIMNWLLLSQDLVMDGLTKHDVATALTWGDELLTERARDVLEIRKESAKSSTAKLKTMMAVTQEDGRARSNLLYHGTSTGRWSGKGIQLQNLPRSSKAFGELDVDVLMSHFRGGRDRETIRDLYYSPLTLVSDAIRSFLVAAMGNEFVVADYANIEGRVTAWLAGQENKLQAFRDYDTIVGYDAAGNPIRKGPDLYLVSAAAIYDVDVATLTDDSPERQVGKVAELALGFAGGVAAFQIMAAGYGVDMGVAYWPLWQAADEKTRERALERYQEQFKRGEKLPEQVWVASELTKVNWRAKNDKIAALWKETQQAALSAVRYPGQTFRCGAKGAQVAYKVVAGFLWAKLPSGRCLAYANPRIEKVVPPWERPVERSDVELSEAELAELLKNPPKPPKKIDALVFDGVDPKTKKWARQTAHGGVLVENNVQAIARDVMAYALLALEKAGFRVVLTIHDEIIVEIKRGDTGALDRMMRIMCTNPSWALGLPLATAGWSGPRYKKK